MKTEGITLAQLSVYLPYDLKVIPNGSKQSCRILGIEFSPLNIVIVRYGKIRESKVSFKWFKPILMPLEAITKEQFKAMNWVNEPAWGTMTEHLITILRTGRIDTDSFNYLVANHFDVFELIESDLAISALNSNQ